MRPVALQPKGRVFTFVDLGPRPTTLARARRQCNPLPGRRPVALQPKGRVFTFVDLGPRLITVTHHSAIIGPYHRNARQIMDVMLTWRGTPENAALTVQRYRIDYVL